MTEKFDGVYPQRMKNRLFSNRAIVVFFIAGIVVVFAVLVPYWLTFGTSLSNDKQDWAVFGTYVAPTIAAGFAILTFLGWLYTLVTRHSEAKRQEGLETDAAHTEELRRIVSETKNDAKNQEGEFFRAINEVRGSNKAQRLMSLRANSTVNQMAELMQKLSHYLTELEKHSPGSPLLSDARLDVKMIAITLHNNKSIDDNMFNTFLKDVPF